MTDIEIYKYLIEEGKRLGLPESDELMIEYQNKLKKLEQDQTNDSE